MKVILNGNIYILQAGTKVTRAPLLEWPQNIRLDGQQKRKDRSYLSSWAIDSWSGGLGIQKMNVDNASHQSRLWDVENCDTRFPNQIVLSPAFNTASLVPSRGDLNLAFQYISDFYFVETAMPGSLTIGAVSIVQGGITFRFTPPFTLGSFRGVGSLSEAIGSINAIRAFGGQIAFVANAEGSVGGVWDRTLGAFRVPTLGGAIATMGTPKLVGSHTNLFSQIGDFGGTCHILAYDPVNNHARMFIASDALAALTAVATANTSIGSYISPLISDGVTMFAQLPGGIYDFDASPAVIVDTSRASEMNGAMALFKNDLYFKNKNSLIKYDGTNVTSIGYDQEDGLPSDKWGEITALASTWKWLFAAVNGATYSHIYTYDGAAWQYYARIPTAGVWVREMMLSNLPDSIDRLWCLFGSYSYPGYFLNPMVNPLQAATYSYVPTGEFTPPIYDGGLSEVPGAFYDKTLIADGLGGSNIVTVFYGLNGNSPVTTLGVVATAPAQLIYGSPYGLEGYRIQPKFILGGANGGTSPVFKEAVMHFLKLPTSRESFDFTIDLRETQREQTKPLEAVIGSLNYERESRPLLPFWYGQVATKNVKVLEMPGIEDVEVGEIYQGERAGFIRVKLAEVL